jgi:UDP-2,3-diacylglucosamine hydrolase
MRRLFLSDIHLSPRHPRRSERLVAFLDREAARTDEIYILGDLFDYWIGPKHLDRPDYREALAALRRAVDSGARVTFLCGNRDFYMNATFTEVTGVRLAPDRTEMRLTVGPKQVCLCHGDYLEGRGGLGFRVQEAIRSPLVEGFYTRLPACLADLGARFYRWVSGRKGRRPRRSPHLGAHGLSDEALMAEFRRGTNIIVCGHVHMPQEVPFAVDGRQAVLYTLGDWSEGESYLVEEDGRWQLCSR